jgi:hypothetical protein
MIRTLVGYAVLAFIGVVALKFVFGLLGFAFSIIMTLVFWAVIGFVIYLLLKLFSPDTARRVREMISGHPQPPA